MMPNSTRSFHFVDVRAMDDAIQKILDGDVSEVMGSLLGEQQPSKRLPDDSDANVRQLSIFIEDAKRKVSRTDAEWKEALNTHVKHVVCLGDVNGYPVYGVFSESYGDALYHFCGEVADLREETQDKTDANILRFKSLAEDWAGREKVVGNILNEYAESQELDAAIFGDDSLAVFNPGAIFGPEQYEDIVAFTLEEGAPVVRDGSGWWVKAPESAVIDGKCPACKQSVQETVACPTCGEGLVKHPLQTLFSNLAEQYLDVKSSSGLPRGSIVVEKYSDANGDVHTRYVVEAHGHLLDAVQERTVVEGAKLARGNRAHVCAADGVQVRAESEFDKGSLRNIFVAGSNEQVTVGRNNDE